MQNLEKHVNFENENSRKAYYREFKKVCTLSMIDVNWTIYDEYYDFIGTHVDVSRQWCVIYFKGS